MISFFFFNAYRDLKKCDNATVSLQVVVSCKTGLNIEDGGNSINGVLELSLQLDSADVISLFPDEIPKIHCLPQDI